MIELQTEEPQRNRTNTWRLYWFHATDHDASCPADAETLVKALVANPDLRGQVLPKMPEWGADQQHPLLFFQMQARAEAAESLLTDAATWIMRSGSLSNHGHRRDGSTCAECALLNRMLAVSKAAEPTHPATKSSAGEDNGLPLSSATEEDFPPFGVHPGDSAALLKLRSAIDDADMWPSVPVKEAGDYEAAVAFMVDLIRSRVANEKALRRKIHNQRTELNRMEKVLARERAAHGETSRGRAALLADRDELKSENKQHCLDFQATAEALGILDELPEQPRVLERIAELRSELAWEKAWDMHRKAHFGEAAELLRHVATCSRQGDVNWSAIAAWVVRDRKQAAEQGKDSGPDVISPGCNDGVAPAVENTGRLQVLMHSRTCIWREEDDDGIGKPETTCGKSATHISCVPFVGSPTCEEHKCRCAKVLSGGHGTDRMTNRRELLSRMRKKAGGSGLSTDDGLNIADALEYELNQQEQAERELEQTRIREQDNGAKMIESLNERDSLRTELEQANEKLTNYRMWEKHYGDILGLHLKTAEVERERDNLSRHLGNLLARIHRDGGQRQATIGTSGAVSEADSAVVRWIGLEGENAELKRILDLAEELARWVIADEQKPGPGFQKSTWDAALRVRAELAQLREQPAADSPSPGVAALVGAAQYADKIPMPGNFPKPGHYDSVGTEPMRCNWVSGYGNRCSLPAGHAESGHRVAEPSDGEQTNPWRKPIDADALLDWLKCSWADETDPTAKAVLSRLLETAGYRLGEFQEGGEKP